MINTSSEETVCPVPQILMRLRCEENRQAVALAYQIEINKHKTEDENY